MKILICLCILSGCLAAQDSTKTTTPRPAAKPAKQTTKPPVAMAIPKDAVETTPGFYRWKDPAGKTWTYRRTPFGVSRWPAESVDVAQDAADKQRAVGERTKAVEQGDSIRFEEATPFGKRAWVRKKTDLTETEQKIWDAQQRSKQ